MQLLWLKLVKWKCEENQEHSLGGRKKGERGGGKVGKMDRKGERNDWPWAYQGEMYPYPWEFCKYTENGPFFMALVQNIYSNLDVYRKNYRII